MAENGFITGLRATSPNTDIYVGKPYRFTGKAANLVHDWDALVAEISHYRAEAEKWKASARQLSDALCRLADRHADAQQEPTR